MLARHTNSHRVPEGARGGPGDISSARGLLLAAVERCAMRRYLGTVFAVLVGSENLLSAGLAVFLAAVFWMVLHLGQ